MFWHSFNSTRLLRDHFSLPRMHIHTPAFPGAEVAVSDRQGDLLGLQLVDKIHGQWLEQIIKAGFPRFYSKLYSQLSLQPLGSGFSLLYASFCPSRIMEITHSLEILKHTRLMSAEPLETFR